MASVNDQVRIVRIAGELVEAKIGMVVAGNSGVGKSCLCNLMALKDMFRHETQANSVTDRAEYGVIRMCVHNQMQHIALFNIPGLLEATKDNIERNKSALEAAFLQKPTQIVVFVFGNNGGRLIAEDLHAFEVTCKSYDFRSASLIVVFNKKPRRAKANYEVEMVALFRKNTGWEPPLNAVFIEDIELERNEKTDELVIDFTHEQTIRNRDRLLAAVGRCIPAPHPKKEDLLFDEDVIRETTQKLQESQKLMAENKAAFAQQLAKAEEDLANEKASRLKREAELEEAREEAARAAAYARAVRAQQAGSSIHISANFSFGRD